MYTPKISIITVSYNAEKTIFQTIKSVAEQTYSNIEYIIIDGNSNDRTVEFIRLFDAEIAYWESSPDSGIYEAMNKGVNKATGEWIHFLNSGDVFTSNTVIENIVNQNNKAISVSDVIYGNIICSFSFGKYVFKPLSLKYFNSLFPISHPATLVRRECFEHRCFDIDLKIAADFKFLRQLYFENTVFTYIPISMVLFDAESGISSNNHAELYKENIIIIKGKLSTIDIFKIVFFRIRIYILQSIMTLFPLSWKLYLKKRMIILNHRYEKIYE